MAKFNDYTSLGGKDYHFPPTEWTKILDPLQRESLYSELYAKYWKPLYSYLRTRGFSNEKAKDLVQGFFTDKVLGQELIQKADRSRGKLRSFLLTAVRNYAIVASRGKRLQQGLGTKTDDLAKRGNPEADFNRAWADDLLHQVLKELQIECRRKGKIAHWRLFNEWLVDPQVEGNDVRLRDIAAKHDIHEAAKAYNMISNMKERFRKIMRNHMGQLVDSDDHIDSEIADFIEIFSRQSTRF